MATPRRTALDSALTFKARLGAEPALGERAAVRDFNALPLSESSSPAAQPEERITVKLIVRTDERDLAAGWMDDHGGERVDGDDGHPPGRGMAVMLATLPLRALRALDETDWIRRVEAPRPLRMRLDQARGPVTGLDVALSTHPLTGAGVVVGIVDSGVDWRHRDFVRDDGTTRIERFLHAFQIAGTEVSQFDVFTAAEIDAALSGGTAVTAGDGHGHGTHCASIASGSGVASNGLFRGVAPGAALVATRAEPLLDTHIIRGIRETFEAAGDRPAVVNLSLGGHLGPHDGTSAIENEIARLSGPGRIVVVAAGNEGLDQIHVGHTLAADEDLVIPFRIAGPDQQFADVWIPRGDDVDVFIETPDGGQFVPDGAVTSTPSGLFLADFVEDPINRDQNLLLIVAGGFANDLWKLRIRPLEIVHGAVHAWAGPEPFLFPGASSADFSVGMPGTEERAVVVGSCVSRNRFHTVDREIVTDLPVGGLSTFSSRGPARYGVQKPDIVAPGQFITAALAEGSTMATDPRYTPRRSPVQPGPYITIQGTSMATPFVTGVIALLLEREPGLTPEEIQQRLRITAQRDAATGPVWSPGFGFGKLDVAALLDY
jgi:subtilisin family serine protease